MKLQQNAKEVVLMSIDGMGLVVGEVRFNRQTETAVFALEKAAFFDLYFPCIVGIEQKGGLMLQPHLAAHLSIGSLRIQRSRVSFFVMSHDLHPMLIDQFNSLIASMTKQAAPPEDVASQPGNTQPKKTPRKKGESRVIDLQDIFDKKGRD